MALVAKTTRMDFIEKIEKELTGNIPELIDLINDLKELKCLEEIIKLYKYNIKGSRLRRLYYECSEENGDKLYRTIMLISNNVFTPEQINNNFNLDVAFPFIDDNINLDGIPSYEDDFDSKHELYEEYVRLQKISFTERLKEKRDEIKGIQYTK